MKKKVITLTFFVCTTALAKTEIEITTVMNDRYFQTAECQNYLSSFHDAEREYLVDISSVLVLEDQLSYVSGRDSLIERMESSFKVKGIRFNKELREARESEHGKRDILYAYSDDVYSAEAVSKADTAFIAAIKKMTKEQKKSIYDYMYCKSATTATGIGLYASHFKKYIDFVRARPSKGYAGYFQVSAEKSYATARVGTGNQFAEPKQCYNIWFRSINPLITMKSKIVYRIPNEVSGEVFWQPGRNPNDTRLWLGKVDAVE